MLNRYKMCSFLVVAFSAILLTGSASAQSEPQSQNSSAPHPATEIPIMNGEAGSCSLELSVTADAKPVYAAKVKVHIVYGFVGVRRLDLEAFTNADGKVRFTGLPSRVRRPPLYFQVSKGELMGTAAYDPSVECEAKHDAVLSKPKEADANRP